MQLRYSYYSVWDFAKYQSLLDPLRKRKFWFWLKYYYVDIKLKKLNLHSTLAEKNIFVFV